jgi:hypothetical protein
MMPQWNYGKADRSIECDFYTLNTWNGRLDDLNREDILMKFEPNTLDSQSVQRKSGCSSFRPFILHKQWMVSQSTIQ